MYIIGKGSCRNSLFTVHNMQCMSEKNLETLCASDLGAYSNNLEVWCLKHFNLPESKKEILHGLLFHFFLGNAAKQGQRHIQWEKSSATAQAYPYLPSDYLIPILIACSFAVCGIIPLGIIYGFWPAIIYVYGLGALGLVYVSLRMIAIVLAHKRSGLPRGKIRALDDMELTASKDKITCRPDRIVQIGERLIPEEWKSYYRPHIGDIIQLAAAFLTIEEKYKRRPPYGVLVMGNGQTYRIKNTDHLRNRLLRTAKEMRAVIQFLETEYPRPEKAA